MFSTKSVRDGFLPVFKNVKKTSTEAYTKISSANVNSFDILAYFVNLSNPTSFKYLKTTVNV